MDFHQIAGLAESKGLKAKVLLETETRKVKKDFLFEMFRKRAISSWSGLTDAEIEAEIKKLEQKYDGEKTIDLEYKMNLVIITN